MNILVLNAGSSSLKFRIFRIKELRPLSEPEEVLVGGTVERIGKPDALMTYNYGANGKPQQQNVVVKSVSEAIQEIFNQVIKPLVKVKEPIAIEAVGHRIVHGGVRFFEPVIVDDVVFNDIHNLNKLAPLHNPFGLSGIEIVRSILPDACNVAVFDTAFHHNLPAVASHYALPAALCERLELRRYGFHGISYRYVTDRLSLILDKNPQAVQYENKRLIVCHLGSGASVCAIRNGKSIDTSMGFTPLEGLIMGTRCGDIDPGIVLHLLRTEKMTLDQIDKVLNHQSGLLGMSTISSDLRDLENKAREGHQASQLALECFAYRVCKYIGAYAVALGGVDHLVFTGGIGEHSAFIRALICQKLSFLNLSINEECNKKAIGKEPVAIGSVDTERVWIVPTNEERQIARETFSLLHQNLIVKKESFIHNE